MRMRLGFVVAASAVLASLVPLWASQQALGDCLIEDSFDGYATGLPPVPPWAEDYVGGGVTIAIDDTTYFGPSGKSLYFHDSTIGQGRLQQTFPASSAVSVEYYIRVHAPNYYEGAFVRLIGNGGPDHALGFKNANWIGIHSTLGGWSDGILQYVPDTWYYVRRVVDFTTDQGYFYVEEVGNPTNNVTYTCGEDYSSNSADTLWIVTSESQKADCYVDELRICPLLNLTANVNNPAWGDIAAEPDLPLYVYDDVVRLTAEPDSCRAFSHWEIYDPNHPGDVEYAIIDANDSVDIVMNDDREVTAVFTWPSHVLQWSTVNGMWGSIAIDPNLSEFPKCSEVTLTAHANPGRAFSHWVIYDPDHPGDGNVPPARIDGNNPVVVVMDADREVTAVFTCSSGAGLMLPMVLGALGLFAWARRKP